MQHMTSRWQCGKEFELIERQLQKNTIIMWAGVEVENSFLIGQTWCL